MVWEEIGTSSKAFGSGFARRAGWVGLEVGFPYTGVPIR
jgi:hypothetical protein